MRIQLKQLTPGAEYKIQVRVTDDDAASEWSKQFDLIVPGDNIAPSKPTNLVWLVKGTAFEATWTKPGTSADGSTLKDFRDYQVTLTAAGTSVVYYTAAERFDFAFEDNYNAFKSTGHAQATVQISVRARDLSGNLSAAAISTATNPAPNPPTALTLAGMNEAVAVAWTAPIDDDLAGFNVYKGTSAGFATSASNLVWSGSATGVVYQSIEYDTDLYFKVTAFDVFETESTPLAGGPVRPKSSFTVDTTPPAVPTGLAATIVTDSNQLTKATVSWNAVVADDLQSYQVRYRVAGTTDWSTESIDAEQTRVVLDGLRPYVNYDFAIRSSDFTGNYSAWSSTVTATGATNTAPSAVTGVQATAGGTTVGVIWSANTESDVNFGAGQYEVQIDTATTFNTVNLKSAKTSALVQTFTELVPNTKYYARVRAIDSLGLVGAWSAVVNATPSGINGSVIITNTLAGDRVIANTLDAAALKANSAIISNLSVKAALTIGDASGDGSIQSYGYVAGTTGYRLTKNSFEINQGSISAAALKLQLGTNIIPPQYATFIPVSTYYNGLLRYPSSVTAAPDQTRSKYANGASMKLTTTASDQTIVFNVPLDANQDNGNINVEPGTTYIYSAWAYSNVSTNFATGLTFRSATPTSIENIQSVPANVWTRVYVAATCPAGFTTCEPYVRIYGQAVTKVVNIDAQKVEVQVGAVATPSTWTPPGITQIDGGVIRTGQIQSTATVNVNGSIQPAWAINLNGSAQFGNALIRGTTIVGTAADADQSFIASANYVQGASGWAIRSDGFAELQNLKVGAGQITDDEIGSISASKIVAGTISSSVLISGSISTASTGARVTLDATGMKAFDASNNTVLTLSPQNSSVLVTSPTDTSQVEVKAINGSARIETAPPVTTGVTWTVGAISTTLNDAYFGTAQYPVPVTFIQAPKRSQDPGPPAYRARLVLSGSNFTSTPNGIIPWTGTLSRASLRASQIALNGEIVREGNYPAIFVNDVQEQTGTLTVAGVGSGLIDSSGIQWMDFGSMIYVQGFMSFNGDGAGTTPISIGSLPRQIDRTVTRQNFNVQIDGIRPYSGTGDPYRCSAAGTTLTSGAFPSGIDRFYVPTSPTDCSNVTLVGRMITASTLISFSGFYFTGDTRGVSLSA